jgi:hypothetical protein
MWSDIAIKGGNFFIEPQIFLFYRISDTQQTRIYRDTMLGNSILIREQLLKYLLNKIYPLKTLQSLHKNMEILKEKKLISSEEIFKIFYNILIKMSVK